MPPKYSPIRSFQWDPARQVERLDWMLAQLPRYADWGYQELHLHLEDAVEFPSLPGVARRDAYSYRQFTQLVDTATRVGIKVVPIVNLLGHTKYLIKVPALRELNEIRSADGTPFTSGQVCPLHPRMLEVAEKLLRDMAPFCTAGKVHVGLDESFDLGRHPLSRREIARVGLARHFAGHVNRLHTLTRSLGLRMGMWADMLYYIPEAIALLPADLIAYEWYYHAFKRWPRVELFNFAEADIATALRRRGISIYGCPMNGSARYEPLPHFHDRLANITAWWRHGERIGAEGFLVTSWEPYRLAMETTTVVDAAAASLWLEPGSTDPRKMLERGFERAFGKKIARTGARVALASDRYPFSGYPRWEINERWNTVSRREPLAPFAAEEKFCQRLAATRAMPAPFRASLQFRHYLAVRDVFVRRAARGLASPAEGRRFAAALVAGRRAAREMWQLTRDRRKRGANELILAGDATRLRAWQRGRPVFGGRWQVCYKVHDFAPGLHLVAIEQRQPDGTWKIIQSCYTIEFQTRAAVPRSPLVREHAAPVEWSGNLTQLPQLRAVVRGIGQVKVGDVVLNDGKTSHQARGLGPRSWRVLGPVAPQRGLPPLVWDVNQGAIDFRFQA